MDFQDMAFMTTAWRRPYYFERSLESWASATGIAELRRFVISLGPTDRHAEQVELIERMAPRLGRVEILPQSEHAVRGDGRRVPFGPHRAIAEAADHVFADPEVKFLVFSEEDIVASDDALLYLRWAATEFEHDPRVLIACAHSRGGQGWDLQIPARDADADQEAVRLARYFNPWGWGTWRDRWQQILEPEWDKDCNMGGPMRSGYDWTVQTKILPRHKMRCLVPDASRSQNIGEKEGWASTPERFPLLHAQSFRERRENPQYRLVSKQGVPV